MMQRWNRKKTHFPLLVFLFVVLIVLSILHNERSVLQIQEDTNHDLNYQETSSITFVKPNIVSSKNQIPGMAVFPQLTWASGFILLCFSNLLKVPQSIFPLFGWNLEVIGLFGFCLVLDRFSRCNSTREYSGRKIRWGEKASEYGHRKESSESCDVFSGKWVFDNTSYPLYDESDCPYMSDQLACHKHGRYDLGYQYLRWQPIGCNLKRCSSSSSFLFTLISIILRG